MFDERLRQVPVWAVDALSGHLQPHERERQLPRRRLLLISHGAGLAPPSAASLPPRTGSEPGGQLTRYMGRTNDALRTRQPLGLPHRYGVRYALLPCGRSSVVERQLPKLYVVGSIPIARSNARGAPALSSTEVVYRPISMRDIKESDWKVFKRLREVALERFCERVLGEIARISSDGAKSRHERYVAIYRLVRRRDKEINPIFDYLRRSTAVQQICSIRSHDLMTEVELRQFSPELVGSVERILKIFNDPTEVVYEEDDDADDAVPERRPD
jgi:hypothetical protein